MKQLQIECPEGYEIDQVNSDLKNGIVKFKKLNNLSYEEIAKELFRNNGYYYINSQGDIVQSIGIPDNVNSNNLSTTSEQLRSIIALNKLVNVAKYLNGDWIPCKNKTFTKNTWCIRIDQTIGKLYFADEVDKTSSVYFKSKELAKKALEILGEDAVRKALTLNY